MEPFRNNLKIRDILNVQFLIGFLLLFLPAILQSHGKSNGRKIRPSWYYFLESHLSRSFRHCSNDLATVENSSPSVWRQSYWQYSVPLNAPAIKVVQFSLPCSHTEQPFLLIKFVFIFCVDLWTDYSALFYYRSTISKFWFFKNLLSHSQMI